MQKLWRLGFQASLEEVVTIGGALQFVLAERFSGGSAFVIGSPALHGASRRPGLRVVNRTAFASRADVVVVAFHPNFDYDELRDATQAALRGAYLVGSNRDATFPNSDGLWPGSGAIIAAVEYASGRDDQHDRKARADARADGAGPARAGPRDHGRRPRRRRPRRGAQRRDRRRDRADRSIGPRRPRRPRARPAPVAIAERLETLVLA